MSGLIIKAITLEQIIALAPPMIYYSTLTCWWTHDRLHLQRHPVSKLPCDPRGAPLYETKHVMEFFRQARLKAREGVYGKHGLDAFIAAHHLNCLISETNRSSTCFTTWAEYNQIINFQNIIPVVAPGPSEVNLSFAPIPEKVVQHEPNERVMGRDEPEEMDEGDDEDGEDGEDDLEIVEAPAPPAPSAAPAAPVIPNATEEAKAEPLPAATEVAPVVPLAARPSEVQAGPDTKVPIETSPSLQSLIDKNIKKDGRRKNR